MMTGDKVQLYPTEEQEAYFRNYCGAFRFCYNQALGMRKELYDDYGVTLTKEELTGCLRRMRSNDDTAWLKDIPDMVPKYAVADLMTACKNFFEGNAGFPHFKKKGKCRESFVQRADRIRMTDSKHIRLTGIREPVCIQRKLKADHIYDVRVSFDGMNWWLSYSYKIPDPVPSASLDVIGIDPGVKVQAVTSDGDVYENINRTPEMKRLQKKLKRWQRKLDRMYLLANPGGIEKGKSLNKTKNIIKLEADVAKIHKRMADIRHTYLHEITSAVVKAKPRAVVLEDLNVKGMLKNRHLSRAVQEQNFRMFRTMLTYKCERSGIEVVIADRYFPSSKTCSSCGTVKKDLRLSERTFVCPECGARRDRDFNAALNLKNYGISRLNF